MSELGLLDGALAHELRGLREEVARLLKVVERPMPLVLTRQRAAEELSISLTTLKGLIRERRLAQVFIGNRWLIPASEIRRLATPAPPAGPRGRPPRGPIEKGRSPREEAERLRAMLREKRRVPPKEPHRGIVPL